MQNKQSSLSESLYLLHLSFETFCDSIEIADYPLPPLVKIEAFNSRTRSVSMLYGAIDRLVEATGGGKCLE